MLQYKGINMAMYTIINPVIAECLDCNAVVINNNQVYNSPAMLKNTS